MSEKTAKERTNEQEVKIRQKEIGKLEQEERILKSMIQEARGQLTQLQIEAMEIKSKMRKDRLPRIPKQGEHSRFNYNSDTTLSM